MHCIVYMKKVYVLLVYVLRVILEIPINNNIEEGKFIKMSTSHGKNPPLMSV